MLKRSTCSFLNPTETEQQQTFYLSRRMLDIETSFAIYFSSILKKNLNKFNKWLARILGRLLNIKSGIVSWTFLPKTKFRIIEICLPTEQYFQPLNTQTKKIYKNGLHNEQEPIKGILEEPEKGFQTLEQKV
ncbi:CLUMA_CG020595, isoform A [Clunio marinus]|uniref:CLUMA_CG020595, isoform A n=1 Tax=Clunio marinus TaxID=568069 RepID=A0A1J1J5G5_9DIPT|nr:CLUMA_CG020595, isoform A [Clunio marinus]